MRKVSFDFDDTLSFESTQLYAKSLLAMDNCDIEIHIVTSRYEDPSKYPFEANHDDLFKVAEDLAIPKEHIHFTNFTKKSTFFKDEDFIWHLDDSPEECMSINRNTKTKGVYSLGNYIYTCNELLNIQ